MWLLIALLGYLCLAVVTVLDKFIVSEEKISPLEMAFYSSAPLILLLPVIPFLHNFRIGGVYYGIAFISAATFVGAMWTMYKGFAVSEASHLGPFIGAALALSSLGIAPLFTGEHSSAVRVLAVMLLAIGSLIISFEQNAKSRGWHKGMLWGLAAGLLFAVSNTTSKVLYDHYGFWNGIVWTRAFMGICGAALFLLPTFPRHLFTFKPATVATGKKPKTTAGAEIGIVLVDKVAGVLGVGLVQFAIALGSVALVSALSGVQYALLIILIAVLSKFFPAVFKEDFERGELAQEVIAVFFIAAGVGLLLV